MDIDTDFAPSIRDKVVEYVEKRYTPKESYCIPELSSAVCNITTQGTLAAKKSIRQIGKVINVPLSVCDKVAKLIPNIVGISLKKALAESEELKKLYTNDLQIKGLIDDAMLVEGVPDQTGVHAAGVIIADKPISEYAPMFWNEKKNCWVIQYDMISCESDLGMLKMDFLGLKNLDIIMRTNDFIKKTKGISVDSLAIEQADDPTVIAEIYGKADTDGIFQFESGGMKQTLQSFDPQTIEDVILLNAAYRPGPMQYIPQVTDVKFGCTTAHYIVPEMESILGKTYGSPIYQEQIQEIFHKIAGFSLGQADIIRRAMSKKHLNEIEAARDKFFEGFKAKGADELQIEEFWTQLLAFASYAFNKSHAAAYSVVSYYTAWLKHYHPVEYLAALMSYSTRDEVGLYIKNAKDYNISVLPPDVNLSFPNTMPTRNGAIRFGLEGLKSVGADAQKIFNERKTRGKYTSYKNFLIRMNICGVNKASIENLIKSGALGRLINNRQQTVENLEKNLEVCRNTMKTFHKSFVDENISNNILIEKLYEYLSDDSNFTISEEIICSEYEHKTMLSFEKDIAGFYVSGHPLDGYKNELKRYTNQQVSDVCSIAEDKVEVVLAGHINNLRILRRKKDGKNMCSFTFEDLSGSVNAICYTNSYERIKSQLEDGAIVCLKGRIETEKDDEGNISSQKFVVSSGRKII